MARFECPGDPESIRPHGADRDREPQLVGLGVRNHFPQDRLVQIVRIQAVDRVEALERVDPRDPVVDQRERRRIGGRYRLAAVRDDHDWTPPSCQSSLQVVGAETLQVFPGDQEGSASGRDVAQKQQREQVEDLWVI